MADSPKRNTYIISFDVAKGSGERVTDAIKEYGTWAHITNSTWAIVTEERPKEIRHKLAQLLPEGSRLFVIRSGSFAAWRNVFGRSEWLKKYL